MTLCIHATHLHQVVELLVDVPGVVKLTVAAVGVEQLGQTLQLHQQVVGLGLDNTKKLILEKHIY